MQANTGKTGKKKRTKEKMAKIGKKKGLKTDKKEDKQANTGEDGKNRRIWQKWALTGKN